jgi:hypothetical protein
LRAVFRIRDPVPSWPRIRDPEVVFSGSLISDPGSRIPNLYFENGNDNVLDKKFIVLCKLTS